MMTKRKLFFYRLMYYNDNFLYQSRGFNCLKNLKISLTSYINNANQISNIEVLVIEPMTLQILKVAVGNKEEVKMRLYGHP